MLESLRNITAWGGRAHAMLLLAVLAGASLSVYHEVSWARLDRLLESQRLIGRHVVVFGAARRSDQNFAISVGSCNALAAVAGVERAGALVPVGFSSVAQLGPNVPIVLVSGSLLDESGRADAFVGADLAAGTGLPGDGSTFNVKIAGRGVLSAVVAPVQPVGIDAGESLAIRMPSTVRSAPNCVVELAPFANQSMMTAILQGQLDTREGSPSGVAATTVSLDVIQQFRTRPEQWVDLYIGAIGGALCALLCRFLASEMAAYRLSGTTRVDLVRILLLEQIVLAGVMLLSAMLAEFTYQRRDVRVAADLAHELTGALAWIVAFGLGTLSFIFVAPTKLAKNR